MASTEWTVNAMSSLPRTAPDSIPAMADALRGAARERTFACADPVKRAAVLHGYLLALEEVERALDDHRREEVRREAV